MATYKGIHGTKIQNYTSDPANPLQGEVWYNSTSNSLKYFYVNPGSWATSGSLNTARDSLAGVGITTSALAFGGYLGPPGVTANTEDWNGASWSEVNNLNTARDNVSGSGTTTAGLAFGGEVSGRLTATEEWNVPSNVVKTLTD